MLARVAERDLAVKQSASLSIVPLHAHEEMVGQRLIIT